MGQSVALNEVEVKLRRRYTVADGQPLVDPDKDGRGRTRTIVPTHVGITVRPFLAGLSATCAVSGPLLLKDGTVGRRQGHLWFNTGNAPKWIVDLIDEALTWATATLATPERTRDDG